MVQLKDGLATFNGDTKQREVVKVGILFMVGDVPGLTKEQNRVQQNAKTFLVNFPKKLLVIIDQIYTNGVEGKWGGEWGAWMNNLSCIFFC